MENSSLPRMWIKAARYVRFVLSTTLIFLMIGTDAALAADRYWIGQGTTRNGWHDIANWTDAYGGTASGSSVPTSADAVFFDRLAEGNLIEIRNNAFAGSISFGALFTGTLMIFTGSKLRVAGIAGGASAKQGIRMGSGYFIINGTGALSFSGSLIQTGGVIGNGRAGSVMELSGSLITLRRGRFRYSGTIVFEGERDQTFAFSGSHTSTTPASIAVGRHYFSGVTINNAGGTTADDVIVSGSLLRLRTLTITKGNFKLDGPNSDDNAAPSVPLSISGAITIASDSAATFSTDTNVRMSGSLSTGASGRFALSGGTLTMNGIRQNLDAEGTHSNIHNLTIAATSGVYLTSNALVQSTLTLNSSTVLTFAANTLYLTGGTITNNATIRENTGKLVHTGSAVFIANSDYNEDSEVKTGDTTYFTVTDSDENINGTAADTITVVVSLASSGDTETVTLTETAVASGIFRGSIATTNNTATSNDGTLQTTTDKAMTLTYTDAQDLIVKTDVSILTAIQGTSSNNTNSGGGSSRSRGGGGGGGTPGVLPKPTKNSDKPQSRVPTVEKKIPTKKLTVAERKAARIQKLKDMKARMDSRKSKRQGR